MSQKLIAYVGCVEEAFPPRLCEEQVSLLIQETPEARKVKIYPHRLGKSEGKP